MAYRVLEVTLISAKDLKKVTVFSRMRVYAVASISGGDPRMPMHRTHTDQERGRSPMWHAPLRFSIPAGADPRGLALHVLLRAERAFGDRDVGEVFVPVQDLISAAPDDGEHRHLSYQVRRPVSGLKGGVLHISYKLFDAPATTPDAQYMQDAAKQPPKGVDAVTAYPTASARSGAAYPPYHRHQSMPYGSAYTDAYAHHHHHPYGYDAAPDVPPYGHSAPARHGGGMGAALGLGLLGGAVSGIVKELTELTFA